MRKILVYILGFVLICFIIPVVLTNKKEVKPTDNEHLANSNENLTEKVAENTNSKYSEVKLLHKETGEVETLSMDQYLYRSCISRNACKFRTRSVKSPSNCCKNIHCI